ncbi:ABC transporter ATP-binding protein [Clostridium hydrogenum]|uniref:ABC transporter ATP-binding protein n=1 Tax=Clostridium hydrogenum TaxID=2855764 RepID=UPI001F3A771B|nr:oligopeptide/dipeptide ABC transporter ATP-binding protein [Clostridium hydrogenum]
MSGAEQKLIEVNNLKKYFPVKGAFGINKNKHVKAVDDVSFYIKKGETFGLVGESGCGKSTLGRTITRLYDATAGEVIFDGKNIVNLNKKELKPYHKKMQVIFQDPYSSLNPYMNVSEIIDEPMALYSNLSKNERMEKIEELLKRVGMKKTDMEKFPHEFSGGQRQRIGIARALSIDPEFVLCDEPISALDVSIQAQVVNMLEDFQKDMGLTYLFVAHDLSMVKHISNRIGVMYLGKIIEISKSTELYKNPLHPYTKALLSAIPIPDPKKANLAENNLIKGELPSPIDIPTGCRFRTRCPYATALCSEKEPVMKEVDTGHMVACHLF